MDINNLTKEELFALQKNVASTIAIKIREENRRNLFENAKKELGDITETIFKRSIKLNDYIYVKLDEYKNQYTASINRSHVAFTAPPPGWAAKIMLASEVAKNLNISPEIISAFYVSPEHDNWKVSLGWEHTDKSFYERANWYINVANTILITLSIHGHDFSSSIELANPKLFELVKEKYSTLNKVRNVMAQMQQFPGKFIEHIVNIPI